MKKKNDITDTDSESLLRIEPFFFDIASTPLPDKKIEEPVSSSPTPEKGNNSATKVQEQPRHIKIKSNEIPGISIKKILNKNSEFSQDEKPAQAILNKEETESFSQNDLTRIWKEYIESIPEKKLLSTSMQSCIPTLQDEYNIRVLVDNPIQEKEILAERNELLAFLRSKLHNSQIYLYVEIAAHGENKKALSPRDRFSAMLNRNPNIERLRSELDLQLD
jgi:DNA polymerase-3 subunit gamma/tau